MFKIRVRYDKTPYMKAHANVNVQLFHFIRFLPQTRKNMQFKIRQKFKRKITDMDKFIGF